MKEKFIVEVAITVYGPCTKKQIREHVLACMDAENIIYGVHVERVRVRKVDKD